jgi:hypothetical protein
MNYKIVVTEYFKSISKKLIKKFPSLKTELTTLQEVLSGNPTTGQFLGDGIYKIRIKIKSKGKGKSGGARLITFVYHYEHSVYLLHLYDKNEIESISIQEIQKLIKKLNL